ncbi:hypothetical protein [Nocardioides caldifontis]|uniref:hypothetical protein n=1 Tax=Nocardioides caldifontis TaxID=2588938 RepID=UPI0011DFC507|nr:hypothetical protein [Nocardioides caldifontis]
MSPLLVAWGASLIVTLWALPVGIVRMLAYRSGETDHTPTMRTAAQVALALGLLGLVSLAVLSVLLLA